MYVCGFSRSGSVSTQSPCVWNLVYEIKQMLSRRFAKTNTQGTQLSVQNKERGACGTPYAECMYRSSQSKTVCGRRVTMQSTWTRMRWTARHHHPPTAARTLWPPLSVDAPPCSSPRSSSGGRAGSRTRVKSASAPGHLEYLTCLLPASHPRPRPSPKPISPPSND